MEIDEEGNSFVILFFKINLYLLGLNFVEKLKKTKCTS